MRSILLFAVLLVGCSTDDPPCTLGDEGLPPGEPAPGPVPTSPVPPKPGDWADPEEPHGYSRNKSGEVCVCDARDDELRGCVDERPSEDAQQNTSNGPCDAEGNDSDTGEPSCLSWGVCGEVYWCCYSMRCENGATERVSDIFICPKLRGRDNSRAGAWEVWQVHVKAELKALKLKNGLCWIQEASCYADPQGGVCGNYPN